jgi:iron(III) transport system ATP-binding protein
VLGAQKVAIAEPRQPLADPGNVALRVTDLVKQYDGGTFAVQGVSFELKVGEFVSILGPSGCGKTTLLRCVAGLEDISGGTVELGGKVVSTKSRIVPPYKRSIGMVFQSYALWPHMTVAQNVAFPLKKDTGVSSEERRRRVDSLLEILEISKYRQSYPFQLSGGQQQRVALARALVGEPEIVLFDEPLSNLDARLRESVKLMIRRVAAQIGFTALYVTHDRLEAVMISDRIVLMNGGRIVQVDDPLTIFKSPNCRFSADFLGESNFYDGEVVEATRDGTRATVRVAGGLELVGLAEPEPVAAGDRVEVMARIGSVTAGAGHGGDSENAFDCTLTDVIFGGETWRYVGELSASGGTARLPLTFIATSQVGRVGDTVQVRIVTDEVRVFKAGQ